MRNLGILLLTLNLGLLSTLGQTQTSSENPAITPDLREGTVVEKVSQYGEAEKAGMQAGDLLLRWSRDNTNEAKGKIQSPFDLMEIETEQSPRGKVTIEGTRGAESHVWILEPGEWGLETRPNLSGNLLIAYRQGQEPAKEIGRAHV